jgi:AcrR family transcriptional regulator
MTVRESRRAEALSLMADYLLKVGLSGAALRPLAKAAGTSDRMLLYYFADKDELLAAVIGETAARLPPILLASGLGGAPQPFDVLMPQINALMARPDVEPYLNLWLDVSARAARREEPFLTIAGQIGDGFLAWIADLLDAPNEARRQADAARLLALVDGAVLMRAIGRPAIADLATRA